MVILLSQPAVAISAVSSGLGWTATLTRYLEWSLRLSRVVPDRSLAVSWPDIEVERRIWPFNIAHERMGESCRLGRDVCKVSVGTSRMWSRRSAVVAMSLDDLELLLID